MARPPRDHWQKINAQLDLETDYEQISRNLADYEFPWDYYQALRIALFRTYAVPSIGGLLHDTGVFEGDVQKRHDDTTLLLWSISHFGIDSKAGHTSIRRMNQMHGSYDISNEDMLYVLSTFVVMPRRWLRDFGWRELTADEARSGVLYWQRLGRLMGIKDIPATAEEFEDYFDRYEVDNFAYNPKSLAVANATLALAAAPYPRVFRRAVNLGLRALLDDRLLDAYHFQKPPAVLVFLIRSALRVRARVLARMPARRDPVLVFDRPEVKHHRNGYDLEKIGTFPTSTAPGRAANLGE